MSMRHMGYYTHDNGRKYEQLPNNIGYLCLARVISA